MIFQSWLIQTYQNCQNYEEKTKKTVWDLLLLITAMRLTSSVVVVDFSLHAFEFDITVTWIVSSKKFFSNTWWKFNYTEVFRIFYSSLHHIEKMFIFSTHAPAESQFENNQKTIRILIGEPNINLLGICITMLLLHKGLKGGLFRQSMVF